jgi:hypothetical protein
MLLALMDCNDYKPDDVYTNNPNETLAQWLAAACRAYPKLAKKGMDSTKVMDVWHRTHKRANNNCLYCNEASLLNWQHTVYDAIKVVD